MTYGYGTKLGQKMVSKELITKFLAFKFQPSVLGSEILSPAILGSKKKSARFFFVQKETILDREHGRYTKISIPPRNPNGWRLEPPQKKVGFFGLMFSALRQLNFIRDGTEVYKNLRSFFEQTIHLSSMYTCI